MGWGAMSGFIGVFSSVVHTSLWVPNGELAPGMVVTPRPGARLVGLWHWDCLEVCKGCSGVGEDGCGKVFIESNVRLQRWMLLGVLWPMPGCGTGIVYAVSAN